MDTRRQSFHVESGASLDVRCENGSVTLRRGPAGTITVTAQIRAPEACDYQVTCEGNAVRVHARRRGRPGVLAAVFAGAWEQPRADIEVTAPADTQVRVDAANAAIDVDGFDSPVTLRSSNGAVRCAHLAGTTDVAASNGSIRLERLVGTLRVRATNGSISGREIAGAFTVQSTNGSVDLEVSPPRGSENSVQTTNGAVTVGVDRSVAFDVSVSTVHGRATVEVPQPAAGLAPGDRARLDVRTTNGRVRVYALAPAAILNA